MRRELLKLNGNVKLPMKCATGAILKHNYPEGGADYDVKTFRVGDFI